MKFKHPYKAYEHVDGFGDGSKYVVSNGNNGGYIIKKDGTIRPTNTFTLTLADYLLGEGYWKRVNLSTVNKFTESFNEDIWLCHFDDEILEVKALDQTEAKILMQAERIKKGKDYRCYVVELLKKEG